MHSVPRRTPASIAWLLPAGTLCFSCGILLGKDLTSIGPLLVVLVLALAAAALARRWLRFGAALLAVLALGGALGWRAYHPSLPEEGDYLVRGTVVQEVALSEDGQVQSALADVTLDGVPWGDAYWTCYLEEGETPPDWLVPGAQVEMTARVYHPSGQENPGGFDFREYLLQQGVKIGVYGNSALTEADNGFSLRGWAASIRHRLTLQLFGVMGEEAGSYAAAMLLGTRDFIPEDERAAFSELGVAHILSISGFHVGVLAALWAFLTRPLPLGRAARMALDAALLFAYCLLTGGNAPVIRAACLLLWREYVRWRRRQVLPLHLLCVTALVQLAFNPTLLRSASFQLTYGAMLGLVLLYPRLKKLRACPTHRRLKLWEAFCAALAAQLGVLWPQLYWFGKLPLLSLLLNTFILTLASGLILLYWATLICLPIPGLRSVMGCLAAGATELLLGGVRALSELPVTSLWTRQADAFTFAGWAMVLWAGSCLLPGKLVPHRRKLLTAGALLIAALLIPLPERSVTYTQLSVGNADAAVLQDGNMTVVIDTGEDGQALAAYLHQCRQSVDALVITHLHTDHGGGVAALLAEDIPIEVCYLPADAQTPVIDEEMLPLIDALRHAGTEIRYLSRGDVIDLPSGQLTVLWPEKGRVFAGHSANDVCLVLHAEIAGVTMLLTGDLSSAYADYIALPSDIVKAAHHGSKSGATAELLSAAPQALLLSNRLESRETYMAEIAGDVPLYATEKHGAITVTFLGDGAFTITPFK